MSESSVPAFELTDITSGLAGNVTYSTRPLNIEGTVITITGNEVTINSAIPVVLNANLAVNGDIEATGNIHAGGNVSADGACCP